MPSMGLGLQLGRSGAAGAGLNFSALTALPAGRRSSAGWIDQATIASFAKASIWLDAFAAFSDTAATVPALTGDAVAAIKDNAAARTWTQSNSVNRSTLAASPTRLTGDYDKALSASGNTAATLKLLICTSAGIAEAEVSITGTYTLRNAPNLIHWAAGNFNAEDIARIKAFAIAEGAVESWGSPTDWSNYWRNMGLTSWNTSIPNTITNLLGAFYENKLTSWNTPLPSSLVNMNFGWMLNSITSWNVPIPASVQSVMNAWTFNPLTTWTHPMPTGLTNASAAWSFSGMQNFGANLFDGCSCTNFSNAFISTSLTQTSIDNILVSINSNNTSNGTFSQSGGSAPSATGNTAIDAMRGRGWTITVTGGY